MYRNTNNLFCREICLKWLGYRINESANVYKVLKSYGIDIAISSEIIYKNLISVNRHLWAVSVSAVR